MIPGGQSFSIPVNDVNANGQGTGFTWTPSVRIGTQVLIVGGDSRGIGSAGSNPFTIQLGNNTDCLNDASPSSTPGTPAGGSYPTNTDGSGINAGGNNGSGNGGGNGGSSGGGSKTNIGAIVGKSPAPGIIRRGLTGLP